jgi:hypothetical protein
MDRRVDKVRELLHEAAEMGHALTSDGRTGTRRAS